MNDLQAYPSPRRRMRLFGFPSLLFILLLSVLNVSCVLDTGPLPSDGTASDTPSPPSFSPAAGTYDRPLEVTVSAEAGTRILYAFSDTEPRTAYRSPLSVPWGKRTTLSALAEKTLEDGTKLRSEVVSADYQVDLSSVIGTAHVKSSYRPPDPGRLPGETMLSEGIRRASDLGMKAIKVYLFKPQEYDPYDNWSASYESPKALAAGSTFASFFADPRIQTYALTVYSTVDGDNHYFTHRASFSDSEWNSRMTEESRQFRELTAFFLSDPRFAGKTFILQQWEGDWALRGDYGDETRASHDAVLGMRSWLEARQEGVRQARAAFPASSAKVYCAIEANRVQQAEEYAASAPSAPSVDPSLTHPSYIPTVANDILPFVRLDLVSYSAYDTTTAYLPWNTAGYFRDALAYLKQKAWDGGPFGEDCVYIGEFGWPENAKDGDGNPVLSSMLVSTGIRNAVSTALDAGVRWLFYWQLYDNELQDDGSVAGFYLYRQDGSRSRAGDAFAEILPLEDR